MSVTLPDHGILLHVGPHKTGTTAVQGALAAVRPQLRAAGIVYPGDRPEHNRQAAAAIQRALGWEHTTVDRGEWLELARLVKRQSGRTVVSSEVFCEAEAGVARQVITDLDPQRTHVVVTLRPLEKLLPSNWQQYIKSGYRVQYDEWLENVLESREKRPITPSFWLRNNHPDVIRRWAAAAGGPDRLTVVIVDPAKPRSLFDSFEDILRLPRNTLNADSTGPSNRSLSAWEVELLRQLNRLARNEVTYTDYYRYVKRGAVRNLVEGRSPVDGEPAVATPSWAIERAREFSKSDVAEIGAMGVQILGDLEALAPTSTIPDQNVVDIDAVPVSLAATFMYHLLQASVRVGAAERRGAGSGRSTAAVASNGAGAARPAPQTVGARLDRAVAGARRRVLASRLGPPLRKVRRLSRR